METTIKRNTLMDRVINFFEGTADGVATLKEIYSDIKSQLINDDENIPNNFEEKVRCVIYRDKKQRLKRLTKGLYLFTGKSTAGLIIHGDGRKLDEIEDKSIDTIITDHPWSDKKAHKSGNQKNFAADYEDDCFRYTLEDFKQKARVLKDGAYLIECIPTESFSNYEYLYEIKEMAKEAGFQYYAKLMWMKNPEGAINTGRSTKGTEDIMIFTKGKPRRLTPIESKKPYFTKFILPGRVDIPAPKPKDKRHQAEKPVSLYSFLLEATTEEGDIALDQFGGSLNLIEAAVNKNRFAIAYEFLGKFVHKAVNRLGAIPLFVSKEDAQELNKIKNSEIQTIELEDLLGHIPDAPVVTIETIECEEEDIQSTVSDCIKEKSDSSDVCEVTNIVTENIVAKEQITMFSDNSEKNILPVIPIETVKFQKDLLENLYKFKPNLYSDSDLVFLKSINVKNNKDANRLNDLFSVIYNTAYESHYSRLNVQLNSEQENDFKSISTDLAYLFADKIANEYVQPYYKNYIIETEDFAKFMIKKHNVKTLEELQKGTLSHIDDYLKTVANHKVFEKKNIVSVKTMIMKLLV